MAGACVCRSGGGEGESGTEWPSKKMSTPGVGARGGDSETPAPGSGWATGCPKAGAPGRVPGGNGKQTACPSQGLRAAGVMSRS